MYYVKLQVVQPDYIYIEISISVTSICWQEWM